MDTAKPIPSENAAALGPETEWEWQRRVARQVDSMDPTDAERCRRLTLEGLADVDAGRLIDDESMQTWAYSLGTDRELPIPQPG